MSSETSGRPAPAAPDAAARPPSSKRRRTSDRPSLAVPDQADANNARLSPTPRTLTRGSPQRGSSREMTPPEAPGSIKYTRTGRVSKATKGQRVHHCEECGKTYTRAEHLRRHQQNHKPGAFPCDVPGCGRSFYREDLLTRHKSRHDDPLNPPSRPHSRASQTSSRSDDGHPDSALRPLPPQLAGSVLEPSVALRDGGHVAPAEGSSNQIYLKGHIAAPNPHPQLPLAVSGSSQHNTFGAGAFLNPSPPYSPQYDSPTNREHSCPDFGLPYYHQPRSSRARHASHTSYSGYGAFQQPSSTPDSAGSSTVCLPHWAHNAQDFQGNLNNSSDSEASGTAAGVGSFHNQVMMDHVLLPGAFGSSRLLTADDRDAMERDDLVIPCSSRHDSLVDLSIAEPAYSNEERYLGAYWLWVHQLYPVVHRPSFNLHDASPLLKAAMLALGAHALGDSLDKTNARIVHERCVKVLKRRTLNGWHSFRICDMQAAVLVEVYAMFKSRRPPLQFSKAFEDVYQHLANDGEALTPVRNDMVMPGTAPYLEDLLNSTAHITAVQCKQRLLAACYVLDSQHATLFGRPRMSCYSGSGMELPFPTSLVSWDGQRRPQQRLEPYDRVWQALDGGNMDQPAQRRPHDVFQSSLMIACLTDSSGDIDSFHPSDPNKDFTPIAGAMQQSPQLRLAYNTFMLCKHTPIRDLLAVAGESWVMAEKLCNQADFVAAQMEARDWASAAGYPADYSAAGLDEKQQAPVQKALRHALRIMELHMNHPKTGLLFQEWSVYLAAVVIWAHAHISSPIASGLQMQRPRLSVPNPSQPNVSAYEVEQAVASAVANGGRRTLDQEEARRVLLWAKTAIEKVDLPHNCGLTNGALDVLGKLVVRGNEDGWFGA